MFGVLCSVVCSTLYNARAHRDLSCCVGLYALYWTCTGCGSLESKVFDDDVVFFTVKLLLFLAAYMHNTLDGTIYVDHHRGSIVWDQWDQLVA